MLECINKYNKAFIICQPINKYLKRKLFKFKLDNYKNTNNQIYSINNNVVIEKSKIRPFGKWYLKNINKNFNLENISYNCIFSVDKKDILNNSIDYYHNLINEMNYHHNHETGHYLERCWADLFKPKFTIQLKNNYYQHLGVSFHKYLIIVNIFCVLFKISFNKLFFYNFYTYILIIK